MFTGSTCWWEELFVTPCPQNVWGSHRGSSLEPLLTPYWPHCCHSCPAPDREGHTDHKTVLQHMIPIPIRPLCISQYWILKSPQDFWRQVMWNSRSAMVPGFKSSCPMFSYKLCVVSVSWIQSQIYLWLLPLRRDLFDYLHIYLTFAMTLGCTDIIHV